MSDDRLFVPLNTEPYEWFADGVKDVELRGINDRFNPDTVYTGRRVELRRGYNTDDSLWGTVGDVWTFKLMTEIAYEIEHERIIPNTTHRQFIHGIVNLLGSYNRHIAFEVDLD